jgi:hypothetical protein
MPNIALKGKVPIPPGNIAVPTGTTNALQEVANRCARSRCAEGTITTIAARTTCRHATSADNYGFRRSKVINVLKLVHSAATAHAPLRDC